MPIASIPISIVSPAFIHTGDLRAYVYRKFKQPFFHALTVPPAREAISDQFARCFVKIPISIGLIGRCVDPSRPIWTPSDRDTRARGCAGSRSIGKFKCNGYRPELAETGLSGWCIAVEQRDGPRMSPINSAPKASPDVAFRDDCHVGLALTIANRQAPRKITA
jgi:hypothetical protein